MDKKWRLDGELSKHDSLLDGFTIKQLIDAVSQEKVIDEKSARKVLAKMVAIQMQDMNFLFDTNLDIILDEAKKGREQ